MNCLTSYQTTSDLGSQDLGKLENIKKISNYGGDITQCQASFPEIKLWQQQLKNTQKQISNFSIPAHFSQISLFCSKCFAQNCRIQNENMNPQKKKLKKLKLTTHKLIFKNICCDSEKQNSIKQNNKEKRKEKSITLLVTQFYFMQQN